MAGDGGARRRAEDAARQSEEARLVLEKQNKILKERTDRDRIRAQRLLMQQLRAGSGGFFGGDFPGGGGSDSSLGGSGDLN